MSLPRDVGFDKDDFQKHRIYNETESLVNYILNILLLKPGNMPSMPSLGVDIKSFVASDMGALDTETLKSLIISNCGDLLPYLSADEVFVGVVPDNKGVPFLIIKIPIKTKENTPDIGVYYGFYRNELNELKFNFTIDEE